MKKPKYHYRKNQALYGYLFITPFYILFIVFQLYPMIWSFVLSFYKWNGISERVFVSLNNYKAIFSDKLFWKCMSNTIIYLLANVLLIIPLAIIIGQILCSRNLRARKFFKTVTVLPYITSTVAAGIIFSMLFDERIGVINGLIKKLGGTALPWLTDVSLSKIPVILLSLWRNTPWYVLIVMSAMLGVDNQLYEAARLDGANAFQSMVRITIPSIMPVLFFSVINLTIDSARIFTEPYVLTKGGPGSSSMSVVQYMYETGFTQFKLGYSSTIGYMLTFFLLLVSIFYVKHLRKESEV